MGLLNYVSIASTFKYSHVLEGMYTCYFVFTTMSVDS